MTRALPWIIALLISLTANGVMTGLVLHQVAGGPRIENILPYEGHRQRVQDDGGAGNRGFNMRAFMRHLPEDQRAIARQRFGEEREDIRQLMMEARAAQLAAEQALSARPYNAGAAADALNQLRERRFAIESAFETIVLDVVADLPPEERLQALAAGRGGPPPYRRRRHGDERPGPPSRDDF
ncbi:MAG: hypothetical protein COW29_01900 [Rhodobacterales bacterium CG15_BIG_FIL_POST_REV_8_21_14_020_59_13]|nr:MAG: hypothetical protein COW29_01900 [Rhodobacterales bacterium CG15_BIG_FIL_POST_REV_8_21_14_020_59_13]